MSVKSIHSILQETFAPVEKEKWQQTASQEIEGKDPFVELSWNSVDGISLLPYYDQNDVAQLSYLDNFFPKADENSFLGNRAWINAPRVSVMDEKTANENALQHLRNGADGVFFTLNREYELKNVLHEIEWQYCSLFFHSTENDFHTRTLTKFLDSNNFAADSISGSLFWELSPNLNNINVELLNFRNFKSLGVFVKRSSPSDEIAYALAEAVSIVGRANDEGLRKNLINSISFSLSIDTKFFDSIAKLKALRMLWYQVTRAFGLQDDEILPLQIHTRVEKWVSEKYEPHGNMINATASAIAAVLGCCDAITVEPQDESNATMTRVARNVSSVIREESHLNKVSNPLEGSYGLKKITDEIAKNAWAKFQQNLKK
jgi:methylmalonyl-CoA mutase